jgi:tetratricopeptide (TPR) repeat protein
LIQFFHPAMNRLASSITALAILCFLPPAATAQSPAVRDAMSALGRGDFGSAEQKLRTEVAAHPEDAWALSLLGASLDNLKRVAEADGFHRRAVAKAPKSLDILNNFAAHLWLAGREQEAGQVFRQMVAIEPAHAGANLQLARLALKEGHAAEALRCLNRLAPADRENPRALLPRLEALYRTGDAPGGDALAGRLTVLAERDPDLAFAAGLALSGAQQFARAESFFEIALKADPANFTLLFNTGAAAASAGHSTRAREVLEAALRQQPQNVDTLYALALANHALRQWETAVQLLSQAAKIDPARADVQRMLAVATADLGALEDSSAAWNRYLKLRPGDDAARRERGYTDAQRGHPEEGLKDLEWYASRHPDDVLAHYELGQALHAVDLSRALEEFTRALALDPNYLPARTARGSLLYQLGKPELAVTDLEAAAKLRPDDAANLDRLGQTYQALDRSGDAVRILRRASELAPSDSKTLLHFARALADAGSAEESKAVMDRFRRLGPEKNSGVRAGFVEYLSLSDSERRADYQARMEKAIQAHPADASLRAEELKLLLADGDFQRAEAEARAIVGMNPPAPVLADAGRALLASRRYPLAAEFLQKALSMGASEAVATDLAIATRFSRAESLDAARDGKEVVDAVNQAVDSAPERPEVYAAGFALLVAKQRANDAAQLLDRGVRKFPGNRELLLMRSAGAELAGDSASADAGLVAIRNRWPEWRQAWMLQGMVLGRRGHFEEAYATLLTALALGESGPEIRYHLAESAWRAGKKEEATAEIGKAQKLAPDDPWIQRLAAKIAGRGDSAEPDPGPSPYLMRWILSRAVQ